MSTLAGHDDIRSLLGVYALDALDPAEAQLVERHLELCVKCRAEVQEHREVAGLLGYAGHDAPAGLWDRIVASMQEPPPALRLERLPLTQAGTNAVLREAPVVPFDGTRVPGALRRPATMRVRTVAALSAAAAVVVAVLGVQVVRLDHRTSNLKTEITAGPQGPAMAVVDSALRTPGARRVDLVPMSSGETLDAVLLPGGQGYLYDARLTPLPTAETYQLWGVAGSTEVSYGIIGNEPAQVVSFQAGPGITALAVTQEVAGGVSQTTHTPVAAGRVPPV